MNSLYSPSNVKYVYTSALKLSDSSISESSFISMSDTSKEIDTKMFPKLKDNSICLAIAILRSISTTLAFF